MIFHKAAQGTPEWHAARCGAFTASTFEDGTSVLTRKSGDRVAGDPSLVSDEVLGTVAIEMVSGEPFKRLFEGGADTRAGHTEEPEARFAYEARTGALVEEAGVIKTDDNRFGYSTDGLVDDDGLIEVKALFSAARILGYLKDPADFIQQFIAQCNGGLWLTGRQWIDLVVWIPALKSVKKDLNIHRIYRNETAIEALEVKLFAALRRIDLYVEILRANPDAAAALIGGAPAAAADDAPAAPAPRVDAQIARPVPAPVAARAPVVASTAPVLDELLF